MLLHSTQALVFGLGLNVLSIDTVGTVQKLSEPVSNNKSTSYIWI